MDAQERFWSKVDASGDCWLWTAGVFQGSGYGAFWHGSSNRLAHRAAYEFLVGPIPTGKTLDHLCRVKLCVNPDHTQPVSSRENTMRAPNAPATINARKTHCPQGHPLVAGNLVTRKDARKCLLCQRETCRTWRARRKVIA